MTSRTWASEVVISERDDDHQVVGVNASSRQHGRVQGMAALVPGVPGAVCRQFHAGPGQRPQRHSQAGAMRAEERGRLPRGVRSESPAGVAQSRQGVHAKSLVYFGGSDGVVGVRSFAEERSQLLLDAKSLGFSRIVGCTRAGACGCPSLLYSDF